MIIGPITSKTDLEKIRDKANGEPYLGISQSGKIYVLEGGNYRVLQPQEAIDKSGIDPELLKKAIANKGILEEEPEVIAEPEAEAEVVEEPTPKVEEKAPEEEPVTRAEPTPEEEKPEISLTKKVTKRIAKLETLLNFAAAELAELKKELFK